MSETISITSVPVSFVQQGFVGVPQLPNSDPKMLGKPGKGVDEEVKRLKSEHSLYSKYAPLWRFYQAAYEGGTSMTTDTNLDKHARENEDDFADRVKRMRYDNYCEPLVTFFTDFIYSETIERSGGTQAGWFTNFVLDVNRRGDDVTSFMSDVCDKFQIYGLMYGLVDAPAIPDGQVLTKQDEVDSKVAPYWLLLGPLEVLDWGLDDFGNYIYLKRYQRVTKTDDFGRKVELDRYTEWTTSQITVSDVTKDPNGDYTVSATKRNNGLGLIPIAVVRYRKSLEDPDLAVSFLRDLAPQNKAVMNQTSLLDEFLYRQCFNILAMEMDTDLPRAEQEDGEAGTSNVLVYPKGTKAPSYIAPSATPADKILEERRTTVAEMYRRAAQDTVNELFNGGGSSGFSKAQSFRTTVPRIASRAESLEKFEVQMFRLTYEYMSYKWDGSIKYKDHYEITNLADALSQMQTLFGELLIPSPTFAKEEMLRMVYLFDGKISPDKMAKIRQEITTADMTEWTDTMKLHFLGRAAESTDVGTALGQPPAPVPGTSSGMATAGKDKPAAPSTAQKPSLNTKQVAATSSKGK